MKKRKIKQKKLQRCSVAVKVKINVPLFLLFGYCNFKLTNNINVWLEIISLLLLFYSNL